MWRVAEFLSEEKSDRFNNNLGVASDNSAENISDKVGNANYVIGGDRYRQN